MKSLNRDLITLLVHNFELSKNSMSQERHFDRFLTPQNGVHRLRQSFAVKHQSEMGQPCPVVQILNIHYKLIPPMDEL